MSTNEGFLREQEALPLERLHLEKEKPVTYQVSIATWQQQRFGLRPRNKLEYIFSVLHMQCSCKLREI